MTNKKNNWLKLKIDFFANPALKKLRKIAGGDSYLIIYQKIMLLTVNTEGHYHYQKLEATIEEELALILDEDVENIKMALAFCVNTKLAEYVDNTSIYLIEVPKLIGKFDNSAERVAKYRALKHDREKCNTLQNVTCNNVTLIEKEKEKEKEKDIDKDIDKDIKQSNFNKFDFEGFSEIEKKSIEDWLLYKKEKKQPYKPTGLKALRTKLLEFKLNGTLIDAIVTSMAQGYSGIFDSNKQHMSVNKHKIAHEAIHNCNTRQRGDVSDFYK